jgi:nucleotide-binding universal stress UspA family protein
MYRKILVPLDGSALAECSLEHVRAIATGCHVAQVVLLRVVETIENAAAFGLTGDNFLEQAKQRLSEAREYLAKLSDKLKTEGLTIDTAAIKGSAADALLDCAKDNGVDLIIMSTHGHSGVSRWAFGSVADRVIRHAAVPVLTVTPPGCRIG